MMKLTLLPQSIKLVVVVFHHPHPVLYVGHILTLKVL